MLKKLILSILICFYANAATLKIDDKISNFSLPNQFDKIHTVTNEISIIIVTFQKETTNIVNNFLSSKYLTTSQYSFSLSLHFISTLNSSFA